MKSAVKTATGTMDAVAGLELACDHAEMEAVEVPADRCEVVTDFHRLEELFPDWQQLWESDPRAEVFQTPGWARAWWRTFGQQVRLCSPVVFAGDRVIGILPLVQRAQIIQFLGTPEGDYADIICEEHRTTEVLALGLKALLESVDGWNECQCHHLSKHSRLVRYYEQLSREIRSRVRCLPAGPLSTIILRNQREEVFKALLGKHHTKRLQNKLRKAGELKFQLLESSREIDPYLTEFFRHHVRRHASIGRTSSFADPDYCQFIRAVIQELGPEGRVRFGVLELNGRPLAWNLGFEVNGKFLLYQHTFDLNVSDYTPGEVLLWNALEYAKEHVTREFDFGRGDELYKDRFTNYSRDTFSIYLEPHGLKGQLQGAKRSMQRSLLPGLGKIKQIAKSRRSTLRAYRSLRMWAIVTSSCFRRAKQNGELLPYGFSLAKEMFGNAVWERKSSDVFAYETSRLGNSNLAATNSDFDICTAQLGELVDLAVKHPEILSLNQLESCRKRLKSGDRVYVVREKTQIASVCWASGTGKAEEKADEAGKAPRLELTPGIPAMVVEEAWSTGGHDLSGVYRVLLPILMNEAASRKADLLVHCSAQQPVLRKELVHLGFLPKFRAIQSRVFGRTRRDIALPANTTRSAQAA
jgi:CelD/BcsL family acetyltransferase involved in cellulose biosynthesis